jgi:hypothetical protein
VVRPVHVDDDREAIEVLDAHLERAAVEQVKRDGETLAASVVQEDVLDIRLGG